ncbi:centrosomal protein CEP57L1 [Engraulis encrasicolus]|uniref:centrosomal protein CEP57L1 n=1 Tax=Engraulis encrasicolus TaxID=184585 RepID=UPI002FD17C3E
MDTFGDQNIFDSPSKQSYVGSFYMPPDKLTLHGLARGAAESKPHSGALIRGIDVEAYQCVPDAGSRAVISALRTLQEKMRRLELERAQAEKNVERFKDATQTHLHLSRNPTTTKAKTATSSSSSSISNSIRNVPSTTAPSTGLSRGASAASSSTRVQERALHPRDTELVMQLQSADTRCSLLEKQLDYMKKMLRSVGQAETHRAAPPPPHAISNPLMPATSNTHHPPSTTNTYVQPPPDRKAQKENCIDDMQLQMQLEKLDKLERECVKLTNTQSLAERKIQLLERKLQEEEKERKLIQQKADELQRELQINLLLQSASLSESKPPTKKKKKKERSPTQESQSAAKLPIAKRPPFVAGTSTSPSHSVSANLQALLRQHLQGQLVERPGGRRRLAREWERNWWLDYGEDQGERDSGGQQQQQQQQNQTRSAARPRSEDSGERLGRKGRGGDRGQGPREHSPPSTENSPPSMEPSPPDCLSQLLLALQDELGQMSFEHQELVCQISDTRSGRVREDLERELDALVKRMEDKATQITQLRKHQKTVEKLRRSPQSPKKQPPALGSKVTKLGVTGVHKRSPASRKTRPLSGSHSRHSRLLKDDIVWEN